MSWKSFFQNSKSRTEFILTIAVLVPLMLLFSQFLLFIEQRDGVTLSDPLLNLFNPIDLTWFTFALIYLSIILFLLNSFENPYKLMIALQSYGLMVIFRAAAMYLLPLEAPEKILQLHDPFVQLFGNGNILTKDLFFSGHTATLFLIFLLTENKTLKIIFLVSTILVAAAVLIQHVHYSIDVFAAPFAAYCSYKIIEQFHKIKQPEDSVVTPTRE
jgi:hypothetical protein